MVQINGDILYCKSSPKDWLKEKAGIKRNTVRSIRDIQLDGYTLSDLDQCKKVKIINTDTEKTFCRKITDISPWGTWVIISW